MNPLEYPRDPYVTHLAEEGQHPVESSLPRVKPLLVVLIGPIKTWWGRLDSDEYRNYSEWRDAVRVACIQAGHLVFSPHQAWQGAWYKDAQKINDFAIIESDAVIVMTPPDTYAPGTADELLVAREYGKEIVEAPPAGEEQIKAMLTQLATLKANLQK